MNRRLTGFPEAVWRGRVSFARFAVVPPIRSGCVERLVSYGLLACLLLAFAGPARGADETPAATGYEAKAGFLVNFARFVEWPAHAQTNSSKFRIGILDDDIAFPVITQVLTNQFVGPREIETVRVKKNHDLKSFNIIFVTRSQAKRTAAVLEKIGTAPVLTVGETSGFAADGGCINLVMTGHNIRFEINPGAAEQAGLKISSRIASMATVVEKREGAK